MLFSLKVNQHLKYHLKSLRENFFFYLFVCSDWVNASLFCEYNCFRGDFTWLINLPDICFVNNNGGIGGGGGALFFFFSMKQFDV